MNIYKFFMEQFTYQMQNSLNTTKLPAPDEYKKCLAFTGLLTVMPVIGFIIYLIVTGIIINVGLGNVFPEYYLETVFLFCVFFPFIILLALTPSYITHLIRFIKFKQYLWALSISALLIINYTFYILCLVKVYAPVTPEMPNV